MELVKEVVDKIINMCKVYDMLLGYMETELDIDYSKDRREVKELREYLQEENRRIYLETRGTYEKRNMDEER